MIGAALWKRALLEAGERVAESARTLQEAGIVKYTRGHILILDVEGLRETSCECYETVKEQYRQFLPDP